MYADISEIQFVMVAVVQLPEVILVTQISAHLVTWFCASDLPSAASAPRLVGKFPRHDRRLVEVARDEGFDIVFICRLDRRVGIEQIVQVGS